MSAVPDGWNVYDYPTGDPYEGIPLPPDPDEEPTPNRLRTRLLDRAALADLPVPSPLIEGTLDTNTVSLLAGYWGTCKSFIAQDWAACVATGHRWQGRPVDEAMRVLYVAAEGAFGLHERWHAWETAWRVQIDPQMLVVLPDPVHLGTPQQVVELATLVRDEGFGFVVVDTLAKCAVGMDENSAQDMGRVVASMYQIRAATGQGTVLGVHHTGKDKSTIRGSSAIEAGVDCVYLVEGDVNALALRRTKRKDGRRDDNHMLKLDPVPFTDSAVIVHAAADIPDSANRLLSVMMSAFSATGCTKAELRNASEMAPATFSRALNALVDRGLIRNEGTEQRPFYKIEVQP